MDTGTKVTPALHSLIAEEVQKAFGPGGDTRSGMTAETARVGQRGLIEQEIRKMTYQYKSYTDNIVQAGKSTIDFVTGVTGLGKGMDKNATILTKWMVKMVVSLPIIKLMQKVLKDKNDALKKNSATMGVFAKGIAKMSMAGTILWGVGGAILLVLAALGIAYVLLSAAIEGAASPFVQWFQGLNIMEKIVSVVGFLGVGLKVFGGGWSLILVGIAGLLRVVTQEMGFVEAALTTIVSVLMIVGGAFLLVGGTAIFPFIAIGAILVGLGILLWKFKDDITSIPEDLKDAMSGAWSALETGAKEWWATSWLKTWYDKFLFIARTIRGIFGGQSISDSADASFQRTYGAPIVTVNMYGPASASTGRDVGRELGHVLRMESKRQGGASTTGTSPGR